MEEEEKEQEKKEEEEKKEKKGEDEIRVGRKLGGEREGRGRGERGR